MKKIFFAFLIGAAVGILTGNSVREFFKFPADGGDSLKNGTAVIRTGGIEVILNGVRLDKTGRGELKPAAGKQFIIADVTIKNNRPETLQIAPLLNFYLKDSEGKVFGLAVVPTELEMRSGDLLAGDLLREEIGFEVLSGAEGLKLYYEPGVKDAETGIINISGFIK